MKRTIGGRGQAYASCLHEEKAAKMLGSNKRSRHSELYGTKSLLKLFDGCISARPGVWTNTKKIELVFRLWSVLSTPNLSVHLALDTGACIREDAACN